MYNPQVILYWGRIEKTKVALIRKLCSYLFSHKTYELPAPEISTKLKTNVRTDYIIGYMRTQHSESDVPGSNTGRSSNPAR